MEFLVHVKFLYASRLCEQLCIKSRPAIYSCRFKGLVINYARGWATKWENHGSEALCARPQDGKTFRVTPFKEWKNYTKTLCAPAPPSAWLQPFPPPPPTFRRSQTSHAPPSRFVAPPPFPIISDQSLSSGQNRW